VRGSCCARRRGLTGVQIAARVGCWLPTVVKWRGRYAELGIEGLKGRAAVGASADARS